MLPNGNGGDPNSTAPAASSAANGVPGLVAAVREPLQFGVSQTTVQIPGFQLGGLQPVPGEGNAAQQVMSPNAGSPGSLGPLEQHVQQQSPAQAMQERLRGLNRDGTPWEAQRVNIVWHNASVSEQLRGEVLRLNEMVAVTRNAQVDREKKLEDFMNIAAERLTQFAAKVEEEFGQEKAHIQGCIDAWVVQFSEQVISEARIEIGRIFQELKTKVEALESMQKRIEDHLRALETEKLSWVTEVAVEKKLKEMYDKIVQDVQEMVNTQGDAPADPRVAYSEIQRLTAENQQLRASVASAAAQSSSANIFPSGAQQPAQSSGFPMGGGSGAGADGISPGISQQGGSSASGCGGGAAGSAALWAGGTPQRHPRKQGAFKLFLGNSRICSRRAPLQCVSM